MKTTAKLLLAGITTLFCCSAGRAQMIYSNYFDPSGAAVTVNKTVPTFAATALGGSASAAWKCTYTNNTPLPTNGTVLLNGTIATNGGCALLPFTPQTGHVYVMDASINLPTGMPNWVAMGFTGGIAQTNAATGLNVRYTDNPPNGFAWMGVRTGTAQGAYAGARTGNQMGSVDFNPTGGTYKLDIILDTRPAKWLTAAYENGQQIGTNFSYLAGNPSLAGAGIGQTVFMSGVNPQNLAGIQWNYWSLSGTYQPFIVAEPTTNSVSMSGLYTNSITVAADTNGGTVFYQWYTNGVPLVNGGTVSGANSSTLSIFPVSTNNGGAGISYYCVVTNNYGAATSSVGTLTILLNPGMVAQIPNAYTNRLTLFAGTNITGTNYLGSSPKFQVVASGATPLVYFWQTNGVTVGGATNTSFAITNCQGNSPTNFACVVTNLYGTATSAWSVVYAPTPQAPYPQAVLAAQPNDFWRLNETEIGSGDPNVICNDYQSGNNGLYTNTVLARTGYNGAEPTETAAQFSSSLFTYNSYAGQIQNVDFAVTNGGNAAFTVEAWIDSQSFNVGLPVVIQGTYGSTEAFNLGIDTNTAGPYFQFYVRNAAGTIFKADSVVTAGVGTWYHLVGVCDEANSNISLYVDGALAATTNITAKSGLFEASAPISIGGQFKSTIPNPQFTGYVDDVAAYNYALSAGQVVNQYAASGNTVPVAFAGAPLPATVVYRLNENLTLPVTITGQGPLGYYWTDLTTSTVLSSGVSSASGSLNATLTIPNMSSSMNGDQLQLVATNSINSINLNVTLVFQPPPVTLDYSSPILYSNNFSGGTWSLAGTPMTAANALVGGTNTTWVDALGVNDTGILQANGISLTSAQDSWVVPFTPHAGYVYTVSGSLTFSGNPGTWVGIGFAQRVPTNAATGFGRFSDNGTNAPQQGPNGFDWLILTEASGNVQCFTGPGGSGQITNQNGFFTSGAGTHNVQVVLDTTAAQWVMSASVDGSSIGPVTYTSSNPPVGAVGITQNNLSAPATVQWDSFALTQVAPAGGVAPYTLASLPTNVTLLADASLSIPATVFGDASFGYYWSNTNTAAVLGSGATNNTAPLSATLGVADVPAGWNGNTLALVMTNAFGTNISYVTLTVTNSAIIPTNKPGGTIFTIVGSNVVLTMTNGQTGGTYYLLGATNLATPFSQWLPVATNIIITNGPNNGFTFTGTNVVHAGTAQQFYILSNTN
jgi:hypothetical protein